MGDIGELAEESFKDSLEGLSQVAVISLYFFFIVFSISVRYPQWEHLKSLVFAASFFLVSALFLILPIPESSTRK